jgi:hypothetical protein
MRRLELVLNQQTRRSEVNVGRGIRLNLARLISRSLPRKPRRIGIISNDRVFELYGREITRNLKRERYKVFVWLMPEGERYKSFRVLENAVKFLNDNNFERDDLVVALGGGVVGDLPARSAARTSSYDVVVADRLVSRWKNGDQSCIRQEPRGGVSSIRMRGYRSGNPEVFTTTRAHLRLLRNGETGANRGQGAFWSHGFWTA